MDCRVRPTGVRLSRSLCAQTGFTACSPLPLEGEMSPTGDRGGLNLSADKTFSEFEEPLPPLCPVPGHLPLQGERGASGKALRVPDRKKRKYRQGINDLLKLSRVKSDTSGSGPAMTEPVVMRCKNRRPQKTRHAVPGCKLSASRFGQVQPIWAVASISIRASSSIRSATTTTDMAGKWRPMTRR